MSVIKICLTNNYKRNFDFMFYVILLYTTFKFSKRKDSMSRKLEYITFIRILEEV